LGDLNPQCFHWPSLHLDVLAGIYAASAFIQRLTDSAAGPLLRFPQHALLGRAQVAAAPGTALDREGRPST